MIVLHEQKVDKLGYETSAFGKHRRGDQILKTVAGIVGRTLDGVETSAVGKLSEFGMLSVDPRATRKAGREKTCNNQHSVNVLSHCEPRYGVLAVPGHTCFHALFFSDAPH
jgi:hypothetical protein